MLISVSLFVIVAGSWCVPSGRLFFLPFPPAVFLFLLLSVCAVFTVAEGEVRAPAWWLTPAKITLISVSLFFCCGCCRFIMRTARSALLLPFLPVIFFLLSVCAVFALCCCLITLGRVQREEGRRLPKIIICHRLCSIISTIISLFVVVAGSWCVPRGRLIFLPFLPAVFLLLSVRAGFTVAEGEVRAPA